MQKEIIFIFSQPRSGSTLLQRLIAAHPQVCTTAESWLLLPFLYALEPEGSFTEYNNTVCYRAINDFISQLPGKRNTYYKSLNMFVNSLYKQKMKPEHKYFLDKTPRYYLIIQHIIQAFPNSKFIFLFRNPLQIFSSVINTWHKGKLRLGEHYIDLYKGPQLLVQGYKRIKDHAIKINYESLVDDPQSNIGRIFDYLQLEFNESILADFNNIKLQGRMGDATGIQEYSKIDNKSTEKYKLFFNTRLRKKIASRYLYHISKETLNTMGYNLNELKQQVSDVKSVRNAGIADRYNLLIDAFWRIFEVQILKQKTKKLLKSGNKLYCHT